MRKRITFFLEQYLSRKIGAEIKCCLTFLLILCYYCIYRWSMGFTEASILHMLEMIWLAYVLEWIQVLLHSDFDEVDRLGMKEWLMVLIGSGVYAGIGHIAGWFDGNIAVTAGFGIYMIASYLCTFLIYKLKRAIDAKLLNNDLKHFQDRRSNHENR